MSMNKKQRKVKDTIHKFIYFPEEIWEIVIDTPHFQRLRYIKQLGSQEKIFPTATHTSFEHSLGVGHLAKTYIDTLIRNHKQLYQKEDADLVILTVTLAGILRNINYQPYSHIDDKYSSQPTVQMIIDAIYKERFKEFKFIRQKQEQKLPQEYFQEYLVHRVKVLISGQKFTIKPYELLNFQPKEEALKGISLDNRYFIAFYMELTKKQQKIVQIGLSYDKCTKIEELSYYIRQFQQHENLEKFINQIKLNQNVPQLFIRALLFLDKELKSLFGKDFDQNLKYEYINDMRTLNLDIENIKNKSLSNEEFKQKFASLRNGSLFDFVLYGIRQSKQRPQLAEMGHKSIEVDKPKQYPKMLRIFRQLERPWQLDLINNKKHGIDVNLFQSIRTDAYNLGAQKIDAEYELLIPEARIIGNQICYPTKYVDTVYNVFQSRYKLHKNYYNNVFSIAIEQMVQKIFELVSVLMTTYFCDPKFELQQNNQQQNYQYKTKMRYQNFLKFTDNILNTIKDIKEYNGVEQILKKAYNYYSSQEDLMKITHEKIQKAKSDLQKACELIDRINQRKYYLHVKELTYTSRVSKDYNQNLKQIVKSYEQMGNSVEKKLWEYLDQNLVPNQLKVLNFRNKEWLCNQIVGIYNKQPSNTKKLPNQNIKIAIHDIGYGLQDKNPLQSVTFFQKYKQELQITKIPNTDLSMLYTDAYNQLSIKVYLLDRDQDIQSGMIDAVKRFRQINQLKESFTKSTSSNREQALKGNLPSTTNPNLV